MTTHPFPFIGAGEASYYEYAELWVCFARAPSAAEVAKIAKGVPAPLRDTIEWKGRLLWVASERGVQKLIRKAYGKRDEAGFNAAIDAWLVDAHRAAPIELAFRREDHEAGGTRLSDWHRDSLTAVPDAIAALANSGGADEAGLALRLIDAAKPAIAADVIAALRQRVEAAEDADRPDWGAMAAAAAKALGAPAARHTRARSADDLAPALAALSKALPATTKRLAKAAKAGLTVRPGASAAAIAAAEKALGAKLSKPHRALLLAFDGGNLGDVVVLGTAKSGAKGDAELATFTRAWGGADGGYVIVAHTGRDDVIAIPRGKDSPVYLLHGTAGWGGGSITRQCKTLDIALDLAFKAGKVWNNLA